MGEVWYPSAVRWISMRCSPLPAYFSNMDRTLGGASERPRMQRCWLHLGLLIALLLPGSHARAQVGFDRPGGDYASFPMRSADPALCAARCERASRCRAWAFSYPVTESASAICWLKSRVTPRVASPCCVSGVRGTGVIEPRTGAIEFGFDRFGGDLLQFETATDPTRVPDRLRSRGGLPCLDLCAARLCRDFGGLLSQEPHYPSAAQTVLYFRGGQIGHPATRGACAQRGQESLYSRRPHIRRQPS